MGPHDKPCPLLRPCRHQTSYLTSIEDIDLKFQVYSYVVFKIGKYRAQDLFDIYKKQKLKELKLGGKQYAEALGDTDEIKGLLPWPRMLYSTDKLIGYSHNNLTDVNICMPCGNWAHLENVKAVNRK